MMGLDGLFFSGRSDKKDFLVCGDGFVNRDTIVMKLLEQPVCVLILVRVLLISRAVFISISVSNSSMRIICAVMVLAYF